MAVEAPRLAAEALIAGDEATCLAAVEQCLVMGMAPAVVIDQVLAPALTVVGSKFEAGEYFLPDMMISAAIMQKAVARLEEVMEEGTNRERLGKVVLGTVQGDIHDIGKNIVGLMLRLAGFEVIDLGVDVPAARFVEEARRRGADVVGISALMTVTAARQREVVLALEEAGLREHVRVVVGGAPVTREWAQRIGADGYAPDAPGAVRLLKQIVPAKAR